MTTAAWTRQSRQARQPETWTPRAGRPVSAALARLPFAIALILVLAIGVGGVLYLGTKTDETGMRTEAARETSRHLRLTIEELEREVAALGATPRIAAEARALGLVPAGDTAILTIDDTGVVTVLGTPHAADGAVAAGE